jgi:hypothetical protein
VEIAPPPIRLAKRGFDFFLAAVPLQAAQLSFQISFPCFSQYKPILPHDEALVYPAKAKTARKPK